MNVLT